MQTVGLLLLPDCRSFEVGVAIEVWGIDRATTAYRGPNW